jgi:hypothetical protein
LVEANVSEKRTVSIFRAQLTALGSDYIGWKEGKLKERANQYIAVPGLYYGVKVFPKVTGI